MAVDETAVSQNGTVNRQRGLTSVCGTSINTSDHPIFSIQGLDVFPQTGEKRSHDHDEEVSDGDADIHASKRKRLNSE
jgi:hypothetical protein